MNRVVLSAVCLLLVWGLAWGQDSLKGKEVPGSAMAASPGTGGSKAAFETIAKAWQEGKAETLATFLGEGKVSILLPKVAGGVLSKSQAEYVLKDLFKYTVTERFEFTKYDEFVSEGVVGIAERSYRSGKEGPLSKDRISVWLVREGQGSPQWVIREIREVKP